MVGHESFQRLLKLLNKRADLKHRTTYSKLVKATEVKQEIIDINTVKGDLACAAFTTDMWTSAAGRVGDVCCSCSNDTMFSCRRPLHESDAPLP